MAVQDGDSLKSSEAATSEPDNSASAKSPRAIVGIGASAGGLKALRTFFSEIPKDSGLSFVVVVHLAPEHKSHLADLLQSNSALPVTQVTETVKIEPNHVYVIPPAANLDAIDTHLRLTMLEEDRRQRAPIDHFFRTLATTHDGDAIAVILTGTGADGTLGIREIKDFGGMTVAQDPSEAEFDGMPQSAIASGNVDFVLPLERIPGLILRHTQFVPHIFIEDESDQAGKERQTLQKILTHVRARCGRDFSHYKQPTILRRIRRRMQIVLIEEIDQYLDYLRAEPAETKTLADEFLITVSSFFRDREVFDELQKTILPELFNRKKPEDHLRIWSVGCATGEEAYSLAILLLEEAGKHDPPPQIQIFASDIHDRSLKSAREGLYSADIETDISPERLRRFFLKESDGYRVRKEVREVVVFAPHNVLSDPPFSKLDFISCRNVFIYLQRNVQQEIVRLFHYALNPQGYLILGSSKTAELSELFQTENKQLCLYKKRQLAASQLQPPFFPSVRPRSIGFGEPSHVLDPSPSYGALHQRVVERYALPSLLVNNDNLVVHLSENAGRYLLHPGGEPTNSVFKVVREELRIELRSAVHEARTEKHPTRTRPIPLTIDGTSVDVTIHVRPAGEDDVPNVLLIIFDEHEIAQDAALPPESPAANTQELEAEIQFTKERLRGIIEEYETSQEEMKAANEELQSINEEMRSVMEELETSKEELQSMNEELQTANQENRHKVEELSQLTSDLQSLMAATDIATIFLDSELRILRFTPKIEDLFNIRISDRARPISDLTHRLGYPELSEDAHRVLNRLIPIEREVRDDHGNWYLTRILPYRTAENRIEGVVITFVDITGRKQSEDALRESESRYRMLFQSMDEAFIVLEMAEGPNAEIDFRFIEANAAFDKGAGLLHPIGRNWRQVMPAFDEEWITCLTAVARSGESIRFQAWASSLNRWFDVYAWRIESNGRPRIGVLLSDISEQKTAESALRDSEEKFRKLSGTLEDRVSLRTTELEEKHHHLRWLAVELASAEQRERKRLAALLHDDLQQLLVATLMRLRIAVDPSNNDKDATTESIKGAMHLLQESIDRARNLTIQLRPPVLYEDGLISALRWLGENLLERHGLTVEFSIDGPEPNLHDDFKALVFECARELMFNAVKHAGTKKIRVELRSVDGFLHLLVIDKGRGFKVDPNPTANLQGFGLFSIRERLTALGGSMLIDSHDGQGTAIHLAIPLVPPDTIAPPVNHATANSTPASKKADKSSKLTILIVDDHALVRDGIRNILDSDDRFSVLGEAADGAEALEMVARAEPAIVLMDINMPRMNGVEATREIIRRWPGTVVIGLSVNNDDATAQSMINSGAATLCAKAGDSNSLLSTIMECAGARASKN